MNQPLNLNTRFPYALVFVVAAMVGCDSSATKDSPPTKNSSTADSKSSLSAEAERLEKMGRVSTEEVNLDSIPADPISIEEFHKEKAVEKHVGKRVTWKCVIEEVNEFHENGGFQVTGFPVEFEGLKEPKQGTETIGEFSNKYNEYAKKEIARAGQTATFFFKDRATYDKLKDAKGKRATITGVVEAGPINNTADLKHCRLVSLDN